MKDMEVIEDLNFETNTKKHFKEDDITDFVEPKKGFMTWLYGFFVSDKKIGELNGKWAALFKAVLFSLVFVIPTLFTWMIWVTTHVYASQYHIENTVDIEDRIVELEKTDAARSDVMRKIEKMEQQLYSLENSVIPNLDKQNSTEHAKILTTLELILKEVKQ